MSDRSTSDPRALCLRSVRRFLPELSEKELRLVAAFIRGLRKGGEHHG